MKAKVYSKPVVTSGNTQTEKGLPAVTPIWAANVLINANAVVNANLSVNTNWT
ncbi:hypothetical protein [Clostridium felsineum]|uniref:hypothetical protein n=1 Tax=Clostridium felsineum TaxID=36839 RepID=UPI0009CFC3BC|nr:hypothetical protein [Clostridium felsineum]URZ03674.1 hypothetical protein CLAUR_037350 [Clostridium felsineum]URZ03676.1 hypothetical protein CLAUR_037370 [Clostridium felsineum]